MKNVSSRLFRILRAVAQLFGLSAIGTLALAGFVALRHMLETPQALESPLPGEAHLYRWTYGHIYYKLLGAPGAPPLVLLHTPALHGSAYEMRGLVEPLAQRFRVYALDLLGFGLSDRPSLDYTADVYKQMCKDFLTHVVQQPALLVASQLSCNYAIEIAASAPQSCSGLVLISPLALHGEHRSFASFLPPALIEAAPVKMLLYPLLAQAQRLVARLQPAIAQPAGSSISPGADAAYYYATTHRFGAEHAVMALLAGKLALDVSQQVEQVQQPTLVIWGADALGRIQRERFEQHESAPSWGPAGAHIELLPEGGLAVHEELPRAVADTLTRWSESHILPAPSAPVPSSQVSSNEMQPEEQPVELSSTEVEAYCVKCKTKRPIQNPREVMMKNGRPSVRGNCPVCGSQLFRSGKLTPGYPHTPV
jgi:pimeloyl-ACP methyl ester carboxylesterase